MEIVLVEPRSSSEGLQVEVYEGDVELAVDRVRKIVVGLHTKSEVYEVHLKIVVEELDRL